MTSMMRCCLIPILVLFAVATTAWGQAGPPIDPIVGLTTVRLARPSVAPAISTTASSLDQPHVLLNSSYLKPKPSSGSSSAWRKDYKIMRQSQVTPAMTAWAVAILHKPTTYPMGSRTTRMFGNLTVLALVEWHSPDFQNHARHRGVTLFQHR